jgi:hypothetical protein
MRRLEDAPGHGGMRIPPATLLKGDRARSGMMIHRVILTSLHRMRYRDAFTAL